MGICIFYNDDGFVLLFNGLSILVLCYYFDTLLTTLLLQLINFCFKLCLHFFILWLCLNDSVTIRDIFDFDFNVLFSINANLLLVGWLLNGLVFWSLYVTIDLFFRTVVTFFSSNLDYFTILFLFILSFSSVYTFLWFCCLLELVLFSSDRGVIFILRQKNFLVRTNAFYFTHIVFGVFSFILGLIFILIILHWFIYWWRRRRWSLLL